MRKVVPVARVKKPVAVPLRDEAVRVRARRELADLEQARFVAKALTAGTSQDAVAEALQVSQAKVSRIAARVKKHPAILRPSVQELVHRCAAREISNAELVRQLKSLHITYVMPDVAPDSDWAVLQRAVQSGIVPQRAAREVVEDTARRFVEKVTGSMDLEDQSVPDQVVADMVRQAADRMAASLG